MSVSIKSYPRVFAGITPHGALACARLTDNDDVFHGVLHSLIVRIKSSMEEYVFPFPFESPDSVSLIFFTEAGLMADSGG
jgi:hypothetical protein